MLEDVDFSEIETKIIAVRLDTLGMIASQGIKLPDLEEFIPRV